MNVRIGRVTHYYNRLGVAVLKLSGDIRLGDKILFLGHTTDFIQSVRSMEIDHHRVNWVGAADQVAIKVGQPVRQGDEVYRVSADEETFETSDSPLEFV